MTELEEILAKYSDNYNAGLAAGRGNNAMVLASEALEAMKRVHKEAYTLGRNKTADWIAENALSEFDYGVKKFADLESILAAKTCKELDIS